MSDAVDACMLDAVLLGWGDPFEWGDGRTEEEVLQFVDSLPDVTRDMLAPTYGDNWRAVREVFRRGHAAFLAGAPVPDGPANTSVESDDRTLAIIWTAITIRSFWWNNDAAKPADRAGPALARAALAIAAG